VKVLVGDGLRVCVRPRGEGPELLLIHGFGGGASAWGEDALAGLTGRCALAVDLLGHGASDDPDRPARVSLERVLDDLERVLDVSGVGACPWVGYSMGGRIALAAAVLRPGRVSRLVIESASPGLADDDERAQRRALDEALALRIEQDGVAAWAEEWERQPLFAGRASLPHAVRDRFLAHRKANRAPALAAWLRGMGAGAQPSFWARLGEVAAPTLVLTGERDGKFTAIGERMAAALPDADHRVVPGAGHTVHLESPAAWARAVGTFLSR
jgi:2-succinyl-6-hydroxy-2,4-cyclohexadiene-1-carboxylate synthase